MSTFSEWDSLPKHDPASCERDPCRRCAGPHTPHPPSLGKKDGPRSTDRPDPVIRSIGLASHPTPAVIADALEAAAAALRASGLEAIDMASILASRGYAAVTLGDGGSRGTDTASGPERNAYRPGDRTDAGAPIPPPAAARWWNADHHYARTLADLWKLARHARSSTDELLHHADDVDPTPAGTGSCRACHRECRPTARKPGNRLRSGLCPTCYRAWRRHVDGDNPSLWSDWVAKRREGYTERDADGRVVAIHTPEPDHDIDLTR